MRGVKGHGLSMRPGRRQALLAGTGLLAWPGWSLAAAPALPPQRPLPVTLAPDAPVPWRFW